MARNKKEFIEYISTMLDRILPGGGNGELISKQLNAMTNAELDAYVDKLESGEQIIPLVAPNFSDKKISVKNNLKIAKELGHEFFQRLWLTDPSTGETYLTPEKYLVMLLPVRRQRQLQRKKIRIPEGTRHVDELSGQVTGPSRGSKISLPELQILYSQDLTDPLVELIKYRGGDVKGQQMLYKSLMDTGQASIEALSKTKTKVKSTETLSVILKSMHLNSTI